MQRVDLTTQLREGDIIFTSVPNLLYQCVERATQSPTSHVGIAFRIDGQWMVAESRVPRCCYTPIEDFIGRSKAGWFAVKRLSLALDAQTVQALKHYCDTQMNQWYHLGFKYTSPRQFCSKFVFEAYRCALGIEVGELMTLRQLLQKHPKASTRFWRCWYLGWIPWDRLTITPASQYDDPKLVAVL